jgi:hypothetical protein
VGRVHTACRSLATLTFLLFFFYFFFFSSSLLVARMMKEVGIMAQEGEKEEKRRTELHKKMPN